MRYILEVIGQLTTEDPELKSIFAPLVKRIETEDGYLPPEQAGHRWKETKHLLIQHRPPGHPKAAALAAIFGGTQPKPPTDSDFPTIDQIGGQGLKVGEAGFSYRESIRKISAWFHQRLYTK